MFNILKQANPKLLQTDNGTEFYNNQFQQLMKKYKIRHYSTYSVLSIPYFFINLYIYMQQNNR